MNPAIPTAIKEEHEELHAELLTATKATGKTGEAARAVAKLMHPHFVREEEYAMPPLGLLIELANGNVGPGMADILSKTQRLKVDLGSMLREHQEIVQALKALAAAASAEGKPALADFARRLTHHAMMEEQVLYPAALLVGEYLRVRLGTSES